MRRIDGKRHSIAVERARPRIRPVGAYHESPEDGCHRVDVSRPILGKEPSETHQLTVFVVHFGGPVP